MKKNIIKFSAVILAAFSIAALAGCGSSSDDSSKSNDKTVLSAQEDKTEKTLDPALVGSWQAVIYHTRYTDTYSADGTLKIMEEDMDSPVGGGNYATSLSEYTAYTDGSKLYHVAVNGGGKGVYTYRIEGNTLYVKTSTGIKIEYTKQ